MSMQNLIQCSIEILYFNSRKILRFRQRKNVCTNREVLDYGQTGYRRKGKDKKKLVQDRKSLL